ncbi:tail protein X [Paracoccus aestuariivivens]|uniref:tail protein X n=1 Tax=Paracoccus aestuariivivens TaxID=1820333 RepID=UPI0031B59598
MRSYRSKAGDTADSIAWEVYERQDAGLVEGILEANPGLAHRGPVLPAGLLISIPDALDPTPVQGVRLWG